MYTRTTQSFKLQNVQMYSSDNDNNMNDDKQFYKIYFLFLPSFISFTFYIRKLVTLVEGDPKVPFSLATTPESIPFVI